MENAVLKTKYIGVKELSDLSGVHLTTIRRRIKSGKYTARLVACNGGQQYEILISSVEAELQEKIYQPARPLSMQGDVTALLPAFSLKKDLDCFAPLAMTGQGASVAIVPNASLSVSGIVQAPQKAKDIALAKYQLLRNWEDFRKNYGKVEEDSFATQMSQLEDLCRNSENRLRLLLFINHIKITIEEIATLLTTTKRTIQRNCKDKKYKFETEPSRGAKGEKYLIYLSSLPEDKQVEYFLANQNDYPEIVEMMIMANRRGEQVSKKVNKTEIDREFVHLYSHAKLYPSIYELI